MTGFQDPLSTFSRPPEKLGRFQIMRKLGQGAQSVVYLAFDPQLHREVAVKALRGAADAAVALLNEARAVSRLSHPAIIPVFEAAQAQGDAGAYLVFEYVEGPTLSELLRQQGALEPTLAVRTLLPVLDAVAYAHANQVIHRDLKPSNILMEGDGTPRISDFGIALITRSDGPALTRTDQMVGSPGYAAPEQAFHGEADPRTDVYGLGALLYHLLTTRPPFQGPTVNAILDQLRSSDPLPPRRLNPTIPRDLQTICLKALNKAREERYPSAATMAEDLGKVLAGRPITARLRSTTAA